MLGTDCTGIGRVLRFDDTGGFAPQTMERRARAIFGHLRRTKTSGPEKKASILPAFVCQDAYVRRRWLFEGFDLWMSQDLHFDRDYFLPLPTVDLSATCQKRARYTDAVGFSRSLLRTLRCTRLADEEDPVQHQAALLLPDAVGFWT